MKKEYVAPELEDLGSVADLTLGSSSGKRLDDDFPSGTPFGDLTFS
jgi:hypothetical protein